MKKEIIKSLTEGNKLIKQTIAYYVYSNLWLKDNKTICKTLRRILDKNKREGWLIQEINLKHSKNLFIDRIKVLK